MDVANLGGARDPFAKQGGGDDKDESSGLFVHIRNQQRNGRKSMTTIQGIAKEFDLKRILKAFKKIFNCNGAIIEDEEFGQIIQIQGDHRKEVADFLTEEGIVEKEFMRVHGA
eukprot:GDKI01015814.1.p2 GENE.GDKI01015814.1~~GDKI01015814.1.p2  ORF type:complete len:113 (+),score=51.57 GDKI01015814.1:84-422(+)